MSQKQRRAQIAEQAAEWFIEHRAGPLPEKHRGDFADWIKTSPRHVEEYLKVARTARRICSAAADTGDSVQALLAEAIADTSEDNVVAFGRDPTRERYTAQVSTLRRRVLLTAAAASILVAAFGVWVSSVRDGERFGLAKAYSTARGAQGTWRLPDASVLQLNTDSQVIVSYSNRERLVTINQGEAYFQVAKHTGRPFRVVVGDASIVAVGTQFDVLRRSVATVVTVVEGTVAVFAGETSRGSTGTVVPPRALRVAAGQQARFSEGSGPTLATTANLDRAVGWLRRQIAFDQEPLADVAEEFNRYSSIPFEIDDPALRALPVSGVFDPFDADSFEAFLETLEGVDVERRESRKVVTRKSDRG